MEETANAAAMTESLQFEQLAHGSELDESRSQIELKENCHVRMTNAYPVTFTVALTVSSTTAGVALTVKKTISKTVVGEGFWPRPAMAAAAT